MNKAFLNTLGLLGLAVFAANSQATLLDLSERDYLTSGDSLITYDATTGLEWLDLTYTAGNSILDTEADASIWANGWQWSTTAQTNALLNHTVLPDGMYTNTIDNMTLIDLLGATHQEGVAGEYTHKFTAGISRGHTDPTGWTDYKHAMIEAQTYYIQPYAPIGCDDETYCVESVDTTPQTFSESWSAATYGSWLVRTASVPEPSSLVLFGLSLVGIGFVRCKQRGSA